MGHTQWLRAMVILPGAGYSLPTYFPASMAR